MGSLKNVERILILFKPYCKHLIPSKCQCLSNAWRFASFNLEWFFHPTLKLAFVFQFYNAGWLCPLTYMKHHNLMRFFVCFRDRSWQRKSNVLWQAQLRKHHVVDDITRENSVITVSRWNKRWFLLDPRISHLWNLLSSLPLDRTFNIIVFGIRLRWMPKSSKSLGCVPSSESRIHIQKIGFCVWNLPRFRNQVNLVDLSVDYAHPQAKFPRDKQAQKPFDVIAFVLWRTRLIYEHLRYLK